MDKTLMMACTSLHGVTAIDRFTREREKTELFVGNSYEHLRAEVAQGAGEHLASLAVLAGIPTERQVHFQKRLRESYSTLFEESLSSRDERVRLVNAAWAEGWANSNRRRLSTKRLVLRMSIYSMANLAT